MARGWRTLILALVLVLPQTVLAQDPAQTPAAPAAALAPDAALEAIADQAARAQEERFRAREAKVTEDLKRIGALKIEMEQLIRRNETLRDELVSRQAKIDAANDKQVKKLAKMYEAMAPEEAAPILDTMNEKVALTLFDAMKGKAAAGIMEFMPDKKAARLGEQLAKPK